MDDDLGCNGMLLSDIFDAHCWKLTFTPPHLRGAQFRPAGFIALPLDAGLPVHRCCYITTRLLFSFKLVMESSFGLRSLPVAMRNGWRLHWLAM